MNQMIKYNVHGPLPEHFDQSDGSFSNDKIRGDYGVFVWIGGVSVGEEGLSVNGICYGNNKCGTAEEGEAQYLLDLITLVQPLIDKQRERLLSIVNKPKEIE